jgi:hypothetical protein
MKRLRLYLDTTVWNFPFADDAPEKQGHTLDFFQRVRYGIFEIYTSQAVLEELEGAPEPRRSQVMALWQETSHIRLEIPAEARDLAMLYVKQKALPARSVVDALHVALTTIHQLDALVSWNFKHLANLTRRSKLASVNLGQGDNHPLELVTPLEVLDDEKR